jgi:hypothetical protein
MQDDSGNLKDLFKLAYNMMFASSGDGCSMIVNKNYEFFADKYEKWAKENNLYDDFNRGDHSNYVNFYRDQEGIIFTDEFPEGTSRSFYEFITILPDWYSELIQKQ